MVSPLQRAEPPKFRLLLGEDDALAGLGRRRRHQPGRPGADDQHVAEGVHALVARGVGFVAGLAEAGGAADEPFAEHPEARALQRPR
jgi:hypothetical protein